MTSGPVSTSRVEVVEVDVGVGGQPDDGEARLLQAWRVRVRFVTWATGTRESAPAEVFQADAVTPDGAPRRAR